MSIKRNSEILEIDGTEGSKVKQYFQPGNTQNKINFSIARFALEPGKRTKLHKLKASEVYYIIEGNGILKVDSESFKIGKDDAVYVPPMAEQMVENKGKKVLKFLCIVDPAWKGENEIILE